MKSFKQYIKESVDMMAGVGLGDDIYRFKVSDLIQHAEKKHDDGSDMFPIQRIPTSSIQDNLDHLEHEEPDSKKKRTDNAEIKFPLIATHRDDGTLHILDGTHRLRKAVNGKIEDLPVRVIPRTHLATFKTDK